MRFVSRLAASSAVNKRISDISETLPGFQETRDTHSSAGNDGKFVTIV